jgi:Rrf2 family transcriptional regulator, iron-sulfur cluster assembly transcription factor
MLSNSCRYGIRAVIYLASQPKSAGKTGIRKISADLDLPTPFLAKILQQLAKQKILSSSKGPGGGFSLLRDPRKITLLDIVNSIDSPDVFTSCIMHNSSCEGVHSTNKHCPLHDDYQKTRIDLINLFSNKTIYELVVQADNTDSVII